MELTVQITYMGTLFVRESTALNSNERRVQKAVKKDLFPHLKWMTNLKKLVLIKHGSFYTTENCSPEIRSLLLDDLCSFVFTGERAPASLQSVWIEDYQLATYLLPHWRRSPQKKSYYDSNRKDVDLSDDRNHLVLLDDRIEHLGGIEELPRSDQREAHLRPFLPNLKHLRTRALDVQNQQVYFHLQFSLLRI